MSLGADGSPKSIDSAIRTDSKTPLRQEVIPFRAENQWLRQQLAAQQARIEELESELKRYKNAHTSSSKRGGAGRSGRNNSSGGDGEDSNSDQEEPAGGDDAASDSSPGRDEGHEGTTRTPSEPEETLHVDEEATVPTVITFSPIRATTFSRSSSTFRSRFQQPLSSTSSVSTSVPVETRLSLNILTAPRPGG